MATIDPSLGQLSVLPRELRDAIYVLATCSDHEEVDLHARCHPHATLAFVSRQISSEVIPILSKAMLIKGLQMRCKHQTFVVTLPPAHIPRDEVLAYGLRQTDHLMEHRISNVRNIRFLTHEVGTNDLPLAIIVNLSLPRGCKVQIHGASAWRHNYIQGNLEMFLREFEETARTEPTGARTHVTTDDVAFLAKMVRNLVVVKDVGGPRREKWPSSYCACCEKKKLEAKSAVA